VDTAIVTRGRYDPCLLRRFVPMAKAMVALALAGGMVVELAFVACVWAAALCDGYRTAASTEQLARFVIFGSFVTAKPEPNDVDIVILMEDTFDLASVAGEAALVFQHMEADARFGASVFWVSDPGRLAGSRL